MTKNEFQNLLKIDIGCKEDGYFSKARLVDFHYDKDGNPMALVFNEETRRFKNIPIREIARVHENMVSEPEIDEFTEHWVRLFGNDAGTMDTFRNNYTIRKEGDAIIISPKDEKDGTKYTIVRKMNDEEKAVLEEFEGMNKQTAHDINEMRLERYRMEQGTFNEVDEKAKESIPVNSTKCCKSVREAMEEATKFMSTHVCPEVDKDAVKQMTKAQQAEEPKTESVPDEDWKYNGGSC